MDKAEALKVAQECDVIIATDEQRDCLLAFAARIEALALERCIDRAQQVRDGFRTKGHKDGADAVRITLMTMRPKP